MVGVHVAPGAVATTIMASALGAIVAVRLVMVTESDAAGGAVTGGAVTGGDGGLVAAATLGAGVAGAMVGEVVKAMP